MSYQALLFCPDEKTARVVTQVLSDLEFSVDPCSEPFAAVKKLMAQHFDAIVVDCENEQNATLLFKSARNSGSNQSALAVAVVEGQAGVAKAFRIGANLVLTKPINVEQSKGTLRVARGLLRKADSYKPPVAAAPVATTTVAATTVAATAPPAFQPKRPLGGAPLTPKPALNTFPAQRTPIEATVSDKTSSAFELQQDPTPQPEPAEAALLESMSDSIESKRQASPPNPGLAKEYPWQPVSKPLSEPMASALKRAAEAVGKPESVPAATTRSAIPAGDLKFRPAGHGTASGYGAASAAAPAREISQPGIDTEESVHGAASAKPSPAVLDEIETNPAFGTVSAASQSTAEPLLFAAMQDEKKMAGAGGNKKVFAIVALAMVVIAGVYYHFSEHPESAPPFVQKLVNRQPAPAPAEAQAPVSVPAHASVPVQTPVSGPATATRADSAGPSPISETTNPQADNVETALAHPTLEVKPSPAKPAATTALNPKTANPTPTNENKNENKVVAVAKSGSIEKAPAPTAEIVQPPAPSTFGSGSADQAIAGIASSVASTVPRPATVGTLKISQGLTQGLLIKKVSPVYPQSARQMHIQGTVELQANIGKDGNVNNVKTLKGDTGLARAAIDAVKQWKYKPYTLNNEPVEIQTQITVNFKLP
jgi:periplasmic protein TonB